MTFSTEQVFTSAITAGVGASVGQRVVRGGHQALAVDTARTT